MRYRKGGGRRVGARATVAGTGLILVAAALWKGTRPDLLAHLDADHDPSTEAERL